MSQAKQPWLQVKRIIGLCLVNGCYNSACPHFTRCQKCADALNAVHKSARWANRLVAIKHYGGVCVCCGESTPEFLTFDHKNGGGAQHRRAEGIVGIAVWLIKHGFPDDFQLMCWNCNCARHFNGGVCPHEAERSQLEFSLNAAEDLRYLSRRAASAVI